MKKLLLVIIFCCNCLFCFAGATGGLRYTVERVNAKDTNSHVVRFNAGELAKIRVLGDGDTDLDLYVYDENGNLIERDDDYTDNCYVSWKPKWTGSFTIRIVNRGIVYNRYMLITN